MMLAPHSRSCRDRDHQRLRLMMNKTTCSIDTCERPRVARGWCRSHYARWDTTGDSRASVPIGTTHRAPAIQRLMRRVHLEDRGYASPCWIWEGVTYHNGYGQIGSSRTHRVSYSHYVGPIPEGLVLDHLCRVRECCHPWHLEAVTQRENIARGMAARWGNLLKTHCVHGHAYDEANTHIAPNGRRFCKACRANHDSGRLR